VTEGSSIRGVDLALLHRRHRGAPRPTPITDALDRIETVFFN